MKKLNIMFVFLFFLLAGMAIDNAMGEGQISIPITIEQKMTRGPENAPVAIYEFSSYQ